ncbi:hypothetical protein DFH06DRAFT_989390, partial [Mycena polygramma]
TTTRKLPKLLRPTQVGWIRHGRGLRDGRDKDRPQEIVDVKIFERAWWTWWTALQPEWRGQRKRGVGEVAPEGADWGKLSSSGQNGVSVVAVLYWWGLAKGKGVGPSKGWVDAVEDTTWVLRAMKS